MPETQHRAPSPTSSTGQSPHSSHNYAQAKRELRMPAAARHSSVSMFTIPSNGASMSPGDFSHPSGDVVSPGSIDRVFPIRSAVSIDPTATPMARESSGDGYPGMSLGADNQDFLENGTTSRRKSLTVSLGGETAANIQGDGRKASTSNAQASMPITLQQIDAILTDASSLRSNKSSVSGGASIGSRPGSMKAPEEPALVTARFQHVVTEGGHAVITGRGGETLQRCEDEPIHIPGAIQSFGALLAIKEQAGKLVVHVVSENSQQIIGYAPQQLFGLDNFLDVFTEDQADNLLDHLDFLRDEDSSDVVTNGPEVFMLSIRPPQHRTRKLWCAMHVCPTDKETVICEFEMEDDPMHPLVPREEMTPEPPEDTLGSEPTEEELAESTVNMSKPLRVLRSARKKRGEAAAMEVFNIMSQVQEQLSNAPNLQVFLKVLIGVVKELTGFHRVMIYQFDQTWNGKVVAELVDPRATKDLYKGLNFPASDIPKQARDLYRLNRVRLLYDRDQETARLVCRTIEDLEKPLDLTHAYLRAMSPIHIKYLANMAVRSSMSISINAFNELWGLIACHTYGAKGIRVSFPIRKMCRLVGDTASRNMERLSYASRLQARKLINTTSSATNPSGYIVASSEDLLTLFDSDVGALSIRDETKVMGNPQGHIQEVLAMVEFLRMKRINCVYTSQDMNVDFPDLRYSPGLKSIAGMLYVPLSSKGTDFIVFFRRGVLQEVKWAGNPYEKFVKEGTEGYLEPRKSFKQWSEVIVGRCRDWTQEEIETASVLCLVYGKFIDVWRQKEAALQNSQLTRLLLANSAHEVRTPLNAIINYLEIALEGALDQDTRENLAKSHSASKSLVYVINDLLDLTKTEENLSLNKEESFDLHSTLREASDPFVGDAKRKNIDYTVDIDETLPQDVLGDHRRVRQVVSNLIANAIQHTAEGCVSVRAWRLVKQSTVGRCEVEISVADTGSGMSQDKVDALFQELEEITYEKDLAHRGLLDTEPHYRESSNTQNTLGLGLAVVARTIRNMNGQLRLKTERGKGSKFLIVLGFDLSTAAPGETNLSRTVTESSVSDGGTDMSLKDGEVTLIQRQPTTPQRSLNSRQKSTSHQSVAPSLTRQESSESVHSATGSMKSGQSVLSQASNRSNRSDADRLIDAIQEPLQFTPTEERLGSGGARNALSRSQSIGARIGGDGDAQSPKSRSVGSTKELKSAITKFPGQYRVKDSGTPIRTIRVPEIGPAEKVEGRVKFEEMGHITEAPRTDSPAEMANEECEDLTKHFSVLVAEDDPINSRIMKKRLEKLGHAAYMTVNGEECSSAFGEKAVTFDAVLMDLQMPIVDGFSSTKMIRSYEKTKASSCLSRRAKMNGRIPIFAVSASLLEHEKDRYVAHGFDGWILKPVDFKRVDELLRGIVNAKVRNDAVYESGRWEQGGWFERQSEERHQYEADTTPSGEDPTAESRSSTNEHHDSDPFIDNVVVPPVELFSRRSVG